jgi:hypothetical protein
MGLLVPGTSAAGSEGAHRWAALKGGCVLCVSVGVVVRAVLFQVRFV